MGQTSQSESRAGSQETPSPPSEEQTDWQRQVLYHQRMRTDLGNERKYLGWLRVSLGLITLGFVVERLDLLLAKSNDVPPHELANVLFWAPLVIFGMGAVTIAVATWEFFADRRRIAAEADRKSWLLMGLVILTLVFLVLIAVLLTLR